MKNWLRNYLGINEIMEDLRTVRFANDALSVTLKELFILQRATSSGVSRIIAKLDPMYSSPELDPTRKANSDKIGEAIEKLIAEEKARMHIDGKL